MFKDKIFGVIYIIKHKTDDTKKVYVGSTNYFKRRICQHRKNCNNEKNNLNQFIAYLTRQEYKNKDNEQHKKYYEENKDKLKERTKKYRDENKYKVLEKAKKYYDENKEKFSEKYKEKITCECGSIVRKKDITRHCKSLKHIAFIEKK